jgi:hypothetical protein
VILKSRKLDIEQQVQQSPPSQSKTTEVLKKEIAEEFPLASTHLVKNLVEFEKLIVPYFPELVGDHKAAATEMEWLWTSNQHSSLEFVSHPRANEDLAGLEKALNYLVDFDIPYYLNLNFAAHHFHETDQETIEFFINFLNEINHSINAPANVEGKRKVAHFVETCRKTISISHEKKNINWNGVLAIDSLRTLWWRNTGRLKEAPIYLNSETRFADYLRMGFQFLDVQGDVVAAFRSWRRNMPQYTVKK